MGDLNSLLPTKFNSLGDIGRSTTNFISNPIGTITSVVTDAVDKIMPGSPGTAVKNKITSIMDNIGGPYKDIMEQVIGNIVIAGLIKSQTKAPTDTEGKSIFANIGENFSGYLDFIQDKVKKTNFANLASAEDALSYFSGIGDQVSGVKGFTETLAGIKSNAGLLPNIQSSLAGMLGADKSANLSKILQQIGSGGTGGLSGQLQTLLGQAGKGGISGQVADVANLFSPIGSVGQKLIGLGTGIGGLQSQISGLGTGLAGGLNIGTALQSLLSGTTGAATNLSNIGTNLQNLIGAGGTSGISQQLKNLFGTATLPGVSTTLQNLIGQSGVGGLSGQLAGLGQGITGATGIQDALSKLLGKSTTANVDTTALANALGTGNLGSALAGNIGSNLNYQNIANTLAKNLGTSDISGLMNSIKTGLGGLDTSGITGKLQTGLTGLNTSDLLRNILGGIGTGTAQTGTSIAGQALQALAAGGPNIAGQIQNILNQGAGGIAGNIDQQLAQLLSGYGGNIAGQIKSGTSGISGNILSQLQSGLSGLKLPNIDTTALTNLSNQLSGLKLPDTTQLSGISSALQNLLNTQGLSGLTGATSGLSSLLKDTTMQQLIGIPSQLSAFLQGGTGSQLLGLPTSLQNIFGGQNVQDLLGMGGDIEGLTSALTGFRAPQQLDIAGMLGIMPRQGEQQQSLLDLLSGRMQQQNKDLLQEYGLSLLGGAGKNLNEWLANTDLGRFGDLLPENLNSLSDLGDRLGISGLLPENVNSWEDLKAKLGLNNMNANIDLPEWMTDITQLKQGLGLDQLPTMSQIQQNINDAIGNIDFGNVLPENWNSIQDILDNIGVGGSMNLDNLTGIMDKLGTGQLGLATSAFDWLKGLMDKEDTGTTTAQLSPAGFQETAPARAAAAYQAPTNSIEDVYKKAQELAGTKPTMPFELYGDQAQNAINQILQENQIAPIQDLGTNEQFRSIISAMGQLGEAGANPMSALQDLLGGGRSTQDQVSNAIEARLKKNEAEQIQRMRDLAGAYGKAGTGFEAENLGKIGSETQYNLAQALAAIAQQQEAQRQTAMGSGLSNYQNLLSQALGSGTAERGIYQNLQQANQQQALAARQAKMDAVKIDLDRKMALGQITQQQYDTAIQNALTSLTQQQGQQQQAGQFATTTGEQARQYDTSLGENQRQFNTQANLQQQEIERQKKADKYGLWTGLGSAVGGLLGGSNIADKWFGVNPVQTNVFNQLPTNTQNTPNTIGTQLSDAFQLTQPIPNSWEDILSTIGFKKKTDTTNTTNPNSQSWFLLKD